MAHPLPGERTRRAEGNRRAPRPRAATWALAAAWCVHAALACAENTVRTNRKRKTAAMHPGPRAPPAEPGLVRGAHTRDLPAMRAHARTGPGVPVWCARVWRRGATSPTLHERHWTALHAAARLHTVPCPLPQS